MVLSIFDKALLATVFVLVLATIPVQLVGPNFIRFTDVPMCLANLRACNIAGAIGAGVIAMSSFTNAASFSGMKVAQRMCKRLGFHSSLVCLTCILMAAEIGWAAHGTSGNLRIPVPTLMVESTLSAMSLMMFSSMTEQATGSPTVTPPQIALVLTSKIAAVLVSTMPRVFPSVPHIWVLYPVMESLYLAVSMVAFRPTIFQFNRAIDTSRVRAALYTVLGISALLAEMVVNVLYFHQYVPVVAMEGVLIASLLHRLVSIYLQVQLVTRMSSERAMTHAQLAHAQDKLRLQREREDEREKYYRFVWHELRIPLTSVVYGLRWLLTDTALPGEVKEDLIMMEGAADSMSVILSDMLDLAKLEAGAFQISTRPMDLPRLLKDTCMQMKPFADASRISLSWNVAAGCPSLVLGDPTRLAQVLSNFTSNAIKFTPHDGSGRVELVATVETLSQAAEREEHGRAAAAAAAAETIIATEDSVAGSGRSLTDGAGAGATSALVPADAVAVGMFAGGSVQQQPCFPAEIQQQQQGVPPFASLPGPAPEPFSPSGRTSGSGAHLVLDRRASSGGLGGYYEGSSASGSGSSSAASSGSAAVPVWGAKQSGAPQGGAAGGSGSGARWAVVHHPLAPSGAGGPGLPVGVSDHAAYHCAPADCDDTGSASGSAAGSSASGGHHIGGGGAMMSGGGDLSPRTHRPRSDSTIPEVGDETGPFTGQGAGVLPSVANNATTAEGAVGGAPPRSPALGSLGSTARSPDHSHSHGHGGAPVSEYGGSALSGFGGPRGSFSSPLTLLESHLGYGPAPATASTAAAGVGLHFVPGVSGHVRRGGAPLASQASLQPSSAPQAYEPTGETVQLRLSCRDNGAGIAGEEVGKLFQAFQQSSTGVNYKGRGTGLGLAIVKEIVTRHGGTVGVSSVPGRGSEFFVSIPFPVMRRTHAGGGGASHGGLERGRSSASAAGYIREEEEDDDGAMRKSPLADGLPPALAFSQPHVSPSLLQHQKHRPALPQEQQQQQQQLYQQSLMEPARGALASIASSGSVASASGSGTLRHDASLRSSRVSVTSSSSSSTNEPPSGAAASGGSARRWADSRGARSPGALSHDAQSALDSPLLQSPMAGIVTEYSHGRRSRRGSQSSVRSASDGSAGPTPRLQPHGSGTAPGAHYSQPPALTREVSSCGSEDRDALSDLPRAGAPQLRSSSFNSGQHHNAAYHISALPPYQHGADDRDRDSAGGWSSSGGAHDFSGAGGAYSASYASSVSGRDRGYSLASIGGGDSASVVSTDSVYLTVAGGAYGDGGPPPLRLTSPVTPGIGGGGGSGDVSPVAPLQIGRLRHQPQLQTLQGGPMGRGQVAGGGGVGHLSLPAPLGLISPAHAGSGGAGGSGGAFGGVPSGGLGSARSEGGHSHVSTATGSSGGTVRTSGGAGAAGMDSDSSPVSGRVRISVATPSESPTGPAGSAGSPHRQAPRLVHALVVDDAEPVRRFMTRLLAKRLPAGSAVAQAADGPSAVRAVLEAPGGVNYYTLVVMDREMPCASVAAGGVCAPCDGVGATRALRAGGFSGLVIGCTGGVGGADASGTDECSRAFLEAGADLVLPKPAKIDDIVACVNNFLTERAVHQQQQSA